MIYELGTPIHTSTTISRRQLISSAVALGVFGRTLAVAAQESTPASEAEGDADALEVLQAAGLALLEVETFEFSMSTIRGTSSILPGLEMVGVEGKVRRPMDMSATITVKALMATLELSAVSVDGEFYIQNPMSGGAWENMGSAPSMVTMINPDWIINLAVNQVKDARITSEKDGVILIEGYVDLAGSLASLDSEDQGEFSTFLADTPIDVAFWINEDLMITTAEMYGPIFASESADVERRIELSRFNETVEIERPSL